MTPLKIAFLWHQHQPYYNIDGEFFLPWVRLHGIKDYLDIILLLFEYPEVKQTFNLVPSLLMQIDEYVSGETEDKIQRLTNLVHSNLSSDKKTEILQSFFICNEENMITPYPRYSELFNRSRKENSVETFTDQDWLDLQVWYNLTWFGPISRQRPEIKRLFNKGRNFTSYEKKMMMEIQNQILDSILPAMKRLQNLGQIELSVSSLYHPILPLLCNTNSALEAMSGNNVPKPPFIFPEDAEYHLHESVKFYERNFQSAPNGMWPSEGSISDEALELIVKSGIKWIATDEQVMMETLNNSVNRLERFFPRKFNSKSGDITILFRDHFLSDIIGFNYSRWDAKDAATDFINRLKYVRWEISSQYGEDSIKNAVVPIILDGENCWEFFKENGKPFLEELYKQFSDCEELKTVTVSEAILEAGNAYVEPINHVRAGSWINANFHIWIGQDEHVKAWEMLREARIAVEERKDLIASDAYDKAMKEIYISEGSDWFWWYCDSHQAPNKKDFDVIYRKHLINIYNLIGLNPPEILNYPIGAGVERTALKMPENEINPLMNGLKDDHLWSGAGVIDAGAGMDAMHSSGEILDKILFGANNNKIFFRVDSKRKLRADETVILNFNSNKYKIVISNESVTLETQSEISELMYSIEETCTFSIDRNLIGNEFELSIKTKIPDGEVFYPRQGYYKIQV